MQLVEQHIIKSNNPLFKECDDLCLISKNIYNQALYRIKKQYELNGKYKSYVEMDKEFRAEKFDEFYKINTKITQLTLKKLDLNFQSYFKALSKFKNSPDSFTGQPRVPKFKDKDKGRFIVEINNQALLKPTNGKVRLTKTLSIDCNKDVVSARIVPRLDFYVVELVYNYQEVDPLVNSNYASIDLGLNNLATVISNTTLKPFIINGKHIKSINQFYNKKLAKLKSELPLRSKSVLDDKGKRVQVKSSKKTRKLTNKRNNKVKHALHVASKEVVTQLKQHNISKVVIGKNKQWKTGINIGSKNNQKFVSIPHTRFIDMITYKCQMIGIEVVTNEESYTSKCSFLDNEPIQKHNKYLGDRKHRGLFISANGTKINADVNGACNILKKVIPNAFEDGIQAVLVPPYRVKSVKLAA